MGVPTREIGRKISRALGWRLIDTTKHQGPNVRNSWVKNLKGTERWKLILPDEVGKIAKDFDFAGQVWWELTHGRDLTDELDRSAFIRDLHEYTPRVLKILREMQPYIEAAEAEAYSLATIIHPDGSISI